jgi:type IV pilus assembly protein PilE
LPAGLRQAPSSGTANYVIGYAARTATTYTLQAVPEGASATDECGTLTVNQQGVKLAAGQTDASNARVQICWNR